MNPDTDQFRRMAEFRRKKNEWLLESDHYLIWDLWKYHSGKHSEVPWQQINEQKSLASKNRMQVANQTDIQSKWRKKSIHAAVTGIKRHNP